MDPLLILIGISALVMVYPAIKNAIARLNRTDAEVAVPAATIAAKAAQPQPSSCVANLIALAQCLPADKREELVRAYAHELILKELK